MSVSIALLSGKGGSGKTTLALSIADLLCRCGIRTLLIDCDLSTNGATFFYEAELAKQSSNVKNGAVSFSDLLLEKAFQPPIPLEIKSNLDFFPSVQSISGRYLVREYQKENYMDLENKAFPFFDWLRSNYEVILFDCQAGYTELLPVLLPRVDIDLFVLEPDSISGSAMRSLHLKAGNYFGHAKLYQVFNKANAEEFEIYSKITGTFFTNIGTLLFDWKIRQAFSRCQVPDLENTSAKFGSDLCDICKIMLMGSEYIERINKFSKKQHYKELIARKKEVERRIEKEKEELKTDGLEMRIVMRRSFLRAIFIVLSLAALILAIILLQKKDFINDTMDRINGITALIAGMTTSITISSVIGLFFDAQKKDKTRNKHIKSLEQELKEIDTTLEINKQELWKATGHNLFRVQSGEAAPFLPAEAGGEAHPQDHGGTGGHGAR